MELKAGETVTLKMFLHQGYGKDLIIAESNLSSKHMQLIGVSDVTFTVPEHDLNAGKLEALLAEQKEARDKVAAIEKKIIEASGL